MKKFRAGCQINNSDVRIDPLHLIRMHTPAPLLSAIKLLSNMLFVYVCVALFIMFLGRMGRLATDIMMKQEPFIPPVPITIIKLY